MDPELSLLVEKWLDHDNESENSDIRELRDTGNFGELKRRMSPRISFGTAGLRARMEPGFARINSLTVIQTSNGLAEYVLSQDQSARSKGVVIGRDARHRSEKFARLAAAAFISKGIKVWWLEDIVHTPLVPFSVGLFGAAVGIMITASHNPKNDNGYKVYWSNGCQIVPPHDSGIAKAIDDNLWRSHSWDTAVVDRGGDMVNHCLATALPKYNTKVAQLAKLQTGAEIPRFVYTAMHGVGGRYLSEAQNVCFPGTSSQITYTTEQNVPDPEFPTVKFPNPEEAGALDLAMKTADRNGVDLIIANDPDADRFCAAEKLADGTWHQFTGNEMGMLIAAHLCSLSEAGELAKIDALLNTTVSTGMLSGLASSKKIKYVETLTGFKWLGNVALKLGEDNGYYVPYAFEEALGYMFTDVVYDKDGVCAAMVFLAAVARWKRDGKTVHQKWLALCEENGHYAEANTYLLTPNPGVTTSIFEDLRERAKAEGKDFLANIGMRKITWWRDLTVGYDSNTTSKVPELPIDKASQMISAEVLGGSDSSGSSLRTRFTVRGSGTEPKIKLYIESQAVTEAEARDEAKAVQESLIDQWFNPGLYGLTAAGAS